MKFGRTPIEIENRRKRLLIYWFIALGGVFLSVFGIVSFAQGRTFLGGMLIFALFVALVMAYVTEKVDDVQPISLIFSSFLFALATYLLLSGGAEGTGAYWTYPILMLMALMSGPRVGAIFMCSYVSVIALFMLGPFSVTYEYAPLAAARIIITSSCLIVLILASEYIRMGSYGAISEASEVNRQLAITDSLTKLLNRNGLKSQLRERELLAPAVLVVLDIDRFKQINDNYGHDLGDIVLQRLSMLLTKHTKGGDLSARWGGEEFLVILFDSRLDSAEALINKVKNEFESIQFKTDKEDVSVSFSAGITTLHNESEFEEAVKRADVLLYEAKDLGRNTIITDSTSA